MCAVRNKDLTWPEEMSQLAKNKMLKKDDGTFWFEIFSSFCFYVSFLFCFSLLSFIFSIFHLTVSLLSAGGMCSR